MQRNENQDDYLSYTRAFGEANADQSIEVDESEVNGSNALPPQTLTEPATQEDPNVFRILVATDSHLGYAEKDPEIGDDSFRNFEWVLRKARELEVDFLLLAGDLFHENKPSKSTMHRCMTLLRTYCFGDKPIRFQILSHDKAFSGASAQCGPNWLDENVNVSLPCFTIHGNHDDPTGRDFLCPLDSLADARLINYFGKQTQLDRVELYPIVLSKGSSKLALYGLGSIRDERLYRLFKSKKVVFKKSQLSEQANWFNMLLLHQNRVARGNVARIPEETIPSFFDLVIWGHEHDAVASPEWNVSQRFYVIQPGCTVPTSLDEHERGAKYCGLLEVRAKNFRWQKLPIRCTRQLLIDTVSLREVFGDPNNPRLPPDNARSTLLDAALRGAMKTPSGGMNTAASKMKRGKRTDGVSSLQVRIEELCAERVTALIQEAKSERDAEVDAENADPVSRTGAKDARLDERPSKPLVRLRVDFAGGFETFNASRFGQMFAEEVANPETIIKFVRKSLRNAERSHDNGGIERAAPRDRDIDIEDDSRSVEDILCSLLEGSIDERNQVRVVNGKLVADALADFVGKSSTHSLSAVIKECVRHAEQGVFEAALALSHDDNRDTVEVTDADLDKLVKQYCDSVNLNELNARVEVGRAAANERSNQDVKVDAADDDGDLDFDQPAARQPTQTTLTNRSASARGGATARGSKAGSSAANLLIIDDDDEANDEELPPSKAKRARTTTRGGRGRGANASTTRGRGRGRGRKSNAAAPDSDEDW